MPFNAAERVLSAAAGSAGKTAIIHHPVGGAPYPVSYGDLAARANRCAHAISSLIARGDRIAILLNDSPRFCAVFLGIVKAGGVAVVLNTRLSPAEYAHIASDSAAVLVIAEEEFLPTLEAARSACRGLRIEAAARFDEIAAALPATFVAVPARPEDPAFWLYSSGTTGSPKGIVHSHRSCAHAGKLLREVVKADHRTTVFVTSKMFFAFALENAFLAPIAMGATTVLNEAWPEPVKIAEQVERYRPDIFFSVPSFFRRLLGLEGSALAAFAQVPYHYTGGERVPDAISTAWQSATGRPLAGCYGMSETFSNALVNFPGRERNGSCGQLLEGVEARLLNSEDEPVAAGQPGVLWLKHPTIALGYSQPHLTARYFREGWFCSGDLFVTDAEGHFWHQGRQDELLKIAGQWVKPGEVEEAVLAETAVRDAACVVVPDQDGFERLALVVVGRGIAGEAAAAARHAVQARLPRHSQPRWIEELDELPRTPTGKVQRYKLRAWLLEEIPGLSERR